MSARAVPVSLGVVAGLIATLLTPVAPAYAATSTTWTGAGTSPHWSDAANWSDGVPLPDATVVFPVAAASVNDLAPDATLGLVVEVAAAGVAIGGAPLAIRELHLAESATVSIASGFRLPDGYGGGSDDYYGPTIYLDDHARLDISGSLGTVGDSMDVDAPSFSSLEVTFTSGASDGTGAVAATDAQVTLSSATASPADITVDGGLTLLLANAPATGVAQSIAVGAGPLGGPATLVWLADDQFDTDALDSPSLELSNGSLARLGGHSEHIRSYLGVSNSTVDLEGGALTAERVASRGSSAITGGTFTATQYEVGQAVVEVPELTVDSLVTGSEPIDVTLAESGTLHLVNACTATGPMTVSGSGTVHTALGYGGPVTLAPGDDVHLVNDNDDCDPAVGVAPLAPQSLTAENGAPGEVELAWTPPASSGTSALTGYLVQRAAGFGSYTQLGTTGPGQTTFVDDTVELGITYRYRVAGVSSLGPGAFTDDTSVTTPPAPAPPGPPHSLWVVAGDGKVRLSWRAPLTSGDAPVTAYEVFRSAELGPTGELIGTLDASTTSLLDDTVTNGQEYYYLVRAVSSIGPGTATLQRHAAPAVTTGLEMSITQLSPAFPGGRVPLDIGLTNASDVALDGPITVTMLLPFDAAHIDAEATTHGEWVCDTGALGSSTVLTCTIPWGIAALSALDDGLRVWIDVPDTALHGVEHLSYSAASFAATATSVAPFALEVVEPVRAQLEVVPRSVPAVLSADADAPSAVTVTVRNVGVGATVDVPRYYAILPAPLVVHGEIAEGWDCTVIPEPATNRTSIDCLALPEVIGAGGVLAPQAETPPLTMLVTAPERPYRGSGALPVIYSTATAFDPYSSLHAELATVLPQTVADPPAFSLELATLPATIVPAPGASAFRFIATNSGGITQSRPVSFILQVPSGVTFALADPDAPWKCGEANGQFTCTSDDSIQIVPGQSVTGPTVTASLPAGTRAATSWKLNAIVEHHVAMSPSRAFDIEVAPPSREPVLSTAVTVADSPLWGNAASEATVALVGDRTRGPAAPQVVVLLVPDAIGLDEDAIATALSGFPGGAAPPVCELAAGPFPGGAGSALLCAVDEPIPAASRAEVRVGFTTAPEVTGTLQLRAGTLATADGSPAERLLAARALLQAHGAAALADTSELLVRGIAFTADAGVPQRVDAATPADTGLLEPTRVVLDGSGSTQLSRPLSYGWVQTSGPAIDWETPAASGNSPIPGVSANPDFPAGTEFVGAGGATQSAAEAFGRQPAFRAPQLTERAELTFRLHITDGSTVATAVTTVVIDPLADNPPQVTGVALHAVAPDGSLGAALALDAGIAAGTRLRLVYTVLDPEGDPVEIVPEVVRPGEWSTLAFTPVDPHAGAATNFDFSWPEGVAQLLVRATATDGKVTDTGQAIAGYHSIAVGPDPLPLGISVAQPDAALIAGAEFSLSAGLVNATVAGDSAEVRWTLLEAPAGTTLGSAGVSTTGRVPASAQPGDVIQVEAIATRGTGSTRSVARTTLSLPVAAAPQLTLADAPAHVIAPGDQLDLVATASGGAGDNVYSWQLVSPASGGGVLAGAGDTVSYTAPNATGLVTVRVTVTDAAGATATQVHSITVAPPAGLPATDAGAEACAVGGTMSTILEAAQTVRDALGDEARVTVQFGEFQLDLGPAGQLLQGVTGCASDLRFELTGASAHYAGIGFSNLTGSITRERVVIDSAHIDAPSSWNLSELSLVGVSFELATRTLQGTLTTSAALPMLATPSQLSNITTSLTFAGELLQISSTATLGAGTVALTGAYCTSAAPCTEVAGIGLPDTVTTIGAKKFVVAVNAAGIALFGGTFAGSGVIGNASGAVDGFVELQWAGGTALAPDFELETVRLRWSPTALAIAGSAVIADRVRVSLDGTFHDSQNWSLDVAGGLIADWEPADGLHLAAYNEGAGTGTRATGSVARSGGALVYAVALTVDGDWDAGPLSVRELELRFGNSGEAPALCELTAERLYLAVSGLAEVAWGSGGAEKTVTIAVEACIVPGVGWNIASTANLSGVQLAPGLDLSGVSFAAEQRNATPTSPATRHAALFAEASALGVSAAATVVLYQPATGSSAFLANLAVNLGELGLPLDTTGHLIYSSAAVPDLAHVPGLEVGLVASDGGEVRNPLAGVSVARGFTALANFELPDSMGDFMTERLAFRSPSTLTVKVALDGIPVIRASLDAGDGITLMSKSDGTRVAITRVELSISPGGSFGLAGVGTLALPAAEAATPGEVSVMQISAGVTINLAGAPSITMVLAKTGGDWNNALGTEGLVLGDLAIQAGVVFGTGIPTPSLGMGAVVRQLPDSWKDAFGIVSDEEIRFVINISAANPIFELTIGVHNGLDVMQPLVRYGTQLGEAFTIDYASLIIAPFGGSVGPFEYTPGFHLGFASTVVGVGVEVHADVDIHTGSMSASADIDAFTVGGIAFRDTHLAFAVLPTQQRASFDFSGGFSAGPINADARVAVAAGREGAGVYVRAELDASVNDISLGSVATLENASLFARVDLTAGVKTSIERFTIGAAANLEVLGVRSTFYGALDLDAQGVKALDLAVAVAPITIGGTTIGGTGCDASRIALIPAGGGVPEFPSNGPCLQLGYHPQASTAFYLKVSGSLDAPSIGLAIAIEAEVDDTGLAIERASVTLADSLTATIYGARFYFGAKVDQGQVTARDVAGISRTVQRGDFVLHGVAQVKLLSVFAAALTVDVGRIGGNAGAVWAQGAARLDVLSGSSPIQATVTLAGEFSRIDGVSVWSLDGTGALTVGGYRMLSADFHIGSDRRFAISGALSAGPVSAALSGEVTWVNGVKYTFTASGSVSFLGTSVAATVSLSNASGRVTATATFNAALGSYLTVNGRASFSTSGAICVAGSANLGFGLAQAAASFCTPGTPIPGVYASVNLASIAWAVGSFRSASQFAVLAYVGIPRVTLDLTSKGWGVRLWAYGHLYVGVATYNTAIALPGHPAVAMSRGFMVRGSATIGGSLCGGFLGCASGSLSASLSYPPPTFCASIAKIVSGCVSYPPLRIWKT